MKQGDWENSFKVGIPMFIGRGAAAEKAQGRGGPDLMPGACRNEDRIAGDDFFFHPIDFHDTAAFEQIIKLLAGAVVVAVRRATHRQRCLGQALLDDRCVREIQKTADGGAIFGGERGLLGAIANFHGERKSLKGPEINWTSGVLVSCSRYAHRASRFS